MALWGNRDSFSIAGTVAVVNTSSTVTGTNSTFTTQLELGDSIFINGRHRKVVGIASDTSLTIDAAWDTANASGVTITGQDSPKYVLNSDISGNLIFGVNSTEAAVANNQSRGLNTPGWVRYKTYTDANSRVRHKSEVLVAFSSLSGDANTDDTILEDS
jgi:hypothetical protein